MPTGYPDYNRLSRSGNFELYNQGPGTVPYNTYLFRGYVGLWPYVNLFTNVNSGSDYSQWVLQYFSDNTFATTVGFRYAIRHPTAFAVTQYANLTDWLGFYMLDKSTSPLTVSEVSLYATQGYAMAGNLDSGDVPLFQFDGSIAAATLQTNIVSHVRPGNCQLQVNTSAASWTVELWYYDWNGAAYKRLLQVSNTNNGKWTSMPVPMLDAPVEVQMRNNDASAQVFNVSLMGMLRALSWT